MVNATCECETMWAISRSRDVASIGLWTAKRELKQYNSIQRHTQPRIAYTTPSLVHGCLFLDENDAPSSSRHAVVAISLGPSEIVRFSIASWKPSSLSTSSSSPSSSHSAFSSSSSSGGSSSKSSYDMTTDQYSFPRTTA